MKAISIEFFLNEQDQAITWRGPMLHKAIRQFLEDVDWGELDYLLIDLPPGTGDVSMTLAQLLPQAKFVIVTTPQPAAQKVAKRAAETAQRFDLEIAGVIENMSGFTTPDGERFTIFGEGGGQLLADELDVPLLGKIPIQEELRVGADEGSPLVLDDPDAPAAQAIYHAARGLIAATPQQLAVFQPPSGPPVPGGHRHGAAHGALAGAYPKAGLRFVAVWRGSPMSSVVIPATDRPATLARCLEVIVRGGRSARAGGGGRGAGGHGPRWGRATWAQCVPTARS